MLSPLCSPYPPPHGGRVAGSSCRVSAESALQRSTRRREHFCVSYAKALYKSCSCLCVQYGTHFIRLHEAQRLLFTNIISTEVLKLWISWHLFSWSWLRLRFLWKARLNPWRVGRGWNFEKGIYSMMLKLSGAVHSPAGILIFNCVHDFQRCHDNRLITRRCDQVSTFLT